MGGVFKLLTMTIVAFVAPFIVHLFQILIVLYIPFHILHLVHFLLGDKIQISFVKSSIECQRDPNHLLTILTFLTLSLSTTDAVKVLLRIRL